MNRRWRYSTVGYWWYQISEREKENTNHLHQDNSASMMVTRKFQLKTTTTKTINSYYWYSEFHKLNCQRLVDLSS